MNTTDTYNHIDYMEDVATKLVDILHTPTKPRYFKSTGLASLDGLLANIGKAVLPALVAEDQCDLNLIDNTSDNILARPYYAFYVLYPASPNDDNKIFDARKKALATAKKVVAKMRNDYRYGNYGLINLEVGSFRFMGVGPLGDCGYGVMVTFTIIEDSDTAYNETDWDS
jgi:hypothetical protein